MLYEMRALLTRTEKVNMQEKKEFEPYMNHVLQLIEKIPKQFSLHFCIHISLQQHCPAWNIDLFSIFSYPVPPHEVTIDQSKVKSKIFKHELQGMVVGYTYRQAHIDALFGIFIKFRVLQFI